MTQGGTNLPRVGGYNQAVVLDAVRTAGPVSRVELVPLTGLTSQTVSNVVRRLLDAGLITEVGQAPSGGGKPRTLLAARPEGAYAVGIQLDPDAALVVLVNLVGDVVASTGVRLAGAEGASEVVDRVAAAVRRLTADAPIDPARLLGAGVATPGPLDGPAGAVVSPPNFAGWDRVPLLTMFERATGMPVAMDNDATAAAIGERWIGGKARAGSFLFIYLGTGIGAGVVLNNTVLHGDSGNAGEFGHMSVQPGDLVCHCGGYNCLGPYVSPGALVKDLLERYGRPAAERIGVTGGPDDVHQDWKALREAARRGDPAAADVVRAAGTRIGQAAKGAVALLDVSRVVLGGEALRGVETIVCREVEAAVNSTTVARVIRPISVERSVIGGEVGAVGAASLMLHGTYTPGWRMLTQPPA